MLSNGGEGPRFANGLIIGRFMPPHVGHAHLIASARPLCETLWVLVCTLPGEPIPGDLRFAWMQEIGAGSRVVHVDQRIPGAERENPGAPLLWARAIRNIVGVPVSAVFASESYGADLARNLDAAYVPVDPDREAIPISASRIREHPIRYWHFLPGAVRPWYVRRIAVAEAPRAAELSKALAKHLETVAVPWYRHVYRTYGPGSSGALDSPTRDPGSTAETPGALEAAMQRSSEDAAARRSNGTIVVHTDGADAKDRRFALSISAAEQGRPLAGDPADDSGASALPPKDKPRLIVADYSVLITQLTGRPGPVSDSVLEAIEQELGVPGHGIS